MENRPVPNIAVLISGRGSNLRAIVAAVRAGEVRARVAVVLSNRADAAGLVYARSEGLTTAVLTGPGGGAMAELADVALRAPGDSTAQVQEAHIALYHTLCTMLEAHFFPGTA